MLQILTNVLSPGLHNGGVTNAVVSISNEGIINETVIQEVNKTKKFQLIKCCVNGAETFFCIIDMANVKLFNFQMFTCEMPLYFCFCWRRNVRHLGFGPDTPGHLRQTNKIPYMGPGPGKVSRARSDRHAPTPRKSARHIYPLGLYTKRIKAQPVQVKGDAPQAPRVKTKSSCQPKQWLTLCCPSLTRDCPALQAALPQNRQAAQ